MIYFKEFEAYSVFIFNESEAQSIRLPLQMSQKEFCLYLEAALEKIKPSLIITSLSFLPSEKQLVEMKKYHVAPAWTGSHTFNFVAGTISQLCPFISLCSIVLL